jgi:hypothetical protein
MMGYKTAARGRWKHGATSSTFARAMASRRASEYWGAPRKGDDRVWGSGQTPSIQIAIMLLGAAAGFFKVTIPSLGAAGVRDTHILPADLDGREPPGERQPGLFLHTVDGQQDPANPNDRIEIYEFMPDWVRLAFTFTLVDTLPPTQASRLPLRQPLRRKLPPRLQDTLLELRERRGVGCLAAGQPQQLLRDGFTLPVGGPLD